MQLVGTIEESIGRVSDLVHAVKSYAYEGKGQKQERRCQRQHPRDAGDSRRTSCARRRSSSRRTWLPIFRCSIRECSGLNQIWTNLLDNAIDAVPQHGISACGPGQRRKAPARMRRTLTSASVSGQRQRHSAREPAAYLRPLLHDQAGRSGNRDRTRHRATHRRAVRRGYSIQL